MSYRAGIQGNMAKVLRAEPTDPRIVCDGCGLTREVYVRRGFGVSAQWFLAGKPPPKWELTHEGDERRDYCPKCKVQRKNHIVAQGADLWCKACDQREPLGLPLSVKDFSLRCDLFTDKHLWCVRGPRKEE